MLSLNFKDKPMNARIQIKCLFLIFFIFFANGVFAQMLKNNNLSDFNLTEAYTQLNKIDNLMSAETASSLQDLIFLSRSLKEHRATAKSCVEKSEEKLSSISKLIESLSLLSDQRSIQKSEEYKYLQEKKDFFAKKGSDCRLFLFKSLEPTELLKKAIQQQSTYILFKPSLPIWKIINRKTLSKVKILNFGKSYNQLGISEIHLTQWVYGAVTLIFAFLVSSLIYFLSKFLLKKTKKESKLKESLLLSIKLFCFPMTLLGSASLFFHVVFFNTFPAFTISPLTDLVFAYFLSLFILYFFVKIKSSIDSREEYHTLWVRASIFTTVMVVGVAIAIFFKNQNVSKELLDFSRAMFYIPVTLTFASTFWVGSKLPMVKKPIVLLIKTSLLVGTIFVVSLVLLGFYHFSRYFITAVLLTTILSIIALFLIGTVRATDRFLNNKKNPMALKLRSYLGIQPNKKFIEFFFIKITLYATIFYIYLYYLMHAWKVSLNIIDKMHEAVIGGFKIANLHISLINIAIALLSFGILLIIGKWFSAMASRYYRLNEDKETQSAVGAIVGYISFGIAVILFFLIAGVSFTGLAIIAGSISVGIGLGFQNIFNNFFSGILLLLDDNINAGDLIVINGTEGVIRKIRLRSTLITTLSKENIIIPNNDFITNRVINLSQQGGLARIVRQVTVDQQNDAETIKNILLDIARKHPEIKQDKPNEPKVFFRDSDGSNMNLVLLFSVVNIKNKYKVISDINAEIDRTFKERNVLLSSVTYFCASGPKT
jgi:small-conductance mechanosensitive channel